MNTRIQELLSQSTDVFGVEEGYTFDQEEVDLEKFALLIVHECVNIASSEIIGQDQIDSEQNPLIREYLIGNNSGIVDAICAIKQHFSVVK